MKRPLVDRFVRTGELFAPAVPLTREGRQRRMALAARSLLLLDEGGVTRNPDALFRWAVNTAKFIANGSVYQYDQRLVAAAQKRCAGPLPPMLADDLIDGDVTYLAPAVRLAPSAQMILQCLGTATLLTHGVPAVVVSEEMRTFARAASWSCISASSVAPAAVLLLSAAPARSSNCRSRSRMRSRATPRP